MATHQELVHQWRDLQTRYNTVACILERALQDEHDLGLSGFEVLDRLVDRGRDTADPSCADSPHCRMPELAEDMYLSQSALSRTIARLERDGLVARAMCGFDRRAIVVQLTESGRARHAAARETHRRVLGESLA